MASMLVREEGGSSNSNQGGEASRDKINLDEETIQKKVSEPMNSQTLSNKRDNTTTTLLLLLLSSMASRIMQEMLSLVLVARIILSKVCRVEVEVARNRVMDMVAREQVVAMEPLESS